MDYRILMDKAIEASKNAYCPYSKFPVGACVLTDNDKIYTGCNFENSSFGSSPNFKRSVWRKTECFGSAENAIPFTILKFRNVRIAAGWNLSRKHRKTRQKSPRRLHSLIPLPLLRSPSPKLGSPIRI